MHWLKKISILILGTGLLGIGCFKVKAAELPVQEYLKLGPLNFQKPAFAEVKNLQGKVYDFNTLFAYPYFSSEDWRAEDGKTFAWFGEDFRWQLTPSASEVECTVKDSTQFAWVLAQFYVYAECFQKNTLKLYSSSAFEVLVDGKSVYKHLGFQLEGDTTALQPVSVALSLEPGYHSFLIRQLYFQKQGKSVQVSPLKMQFENGEGLACSVSSQEYYDLKHYLNGENIAAVEYSHNAEYYMLRHTAGNPRHQKMESWYEICRSADQVSIDRIEGAFAVTLADHSPRIAYLKQSGEYTRLYVGELGKTQPMVFETTRQIQSFFWDESQDLFVLIENVAFEPSPTGLKNLTSGMDHWSYYRDRQFLHLLDIKTKSCQPLTHGFYSTTLQDVSPDGRWLVFSTEAPVDSLRAYGMETMYLMDMQTKAVKKLWDTPFGGSVQFSPDATRLLVLGSAVKFEDYRTPGVSKDCQDCFIYNDYDIQAFIYNIAENKAECITKDFAPSIQSALWKENKDCIYFRAEEKDGSTLYLYSLSEKTFRKIPLQVGYLQDFDVKGQKLIYCGASADRPNEAFVATAKTKTPGLRFVDGKMTTQSIAQPQKDALEHITMGEYRDWNFRSAEGEIIEATYYLPPHFDAGKKYPCIVYYYGGTSPTPKVLHMRYPKEVWASHGYVVLVLQPSGATGYGSKFAARHVNDWGKIVAQEIIDGTREFCRTHAFVDSTKLGCIGASFGGFTTQNVISKTDLFAAAISHAGISSISSYWGEGYWGYLYNSASAAFSFPWNRKDIYVDQSPLFRADKINTPLLLTHGTSDHNVPIGESYQIYKALRLLGKEVAMVTVEGEDHGIVGYSKRILWEKTLIAWFDKYLKGQPQWWNELYPIANE